MRGRKRRRHIGQGGSALVFLEPKILASSSRCPAISECLDFDLAVTNPEVEFVDERAIAALFFIPPHRHPNPFTIGDVVIFRAPAGHTRMISPRNTTESLLHFVIISGGIKRPSRYVSKPKPDLQSVGLSSW